ncbi:FkbM family methyltransferase [Bradyrhizobium sp. S69]|uniref:FkbM family methyltransferase n=1 Tax=Bradyrhizobium sp. S69 TaxID=1641856 RepID=UPI001FED6336|nr:FkbM family methyltransferase [Bradyrhizobium sp. S69]
MKAVRQLGNLLHFFARCLRYRVRTEDLQIKTLMKLNLGGATVLDIGANKGIYCFFLGRAVGRNGKVIAFEPQPELRDHLEWLKSCLKWKNIEILNVALSEDNGSALLSRKKVGDGSASLESDRRYSDGESIAVETMRLDDLRNRFSDLEFIKCDVEGHEQSVFRGGEQTIRHHRPVVQFEGAPSDDVDQSVFKFFCSLGYSGVMMMGGKYLHYLNPDRVPHYKFGLGGHRDYLFFPPEAVGTIIPIEMFNSFPPPAP